MPLVYFTFSSFFFFLLSLCISLIFGLISLSNSYIFFSSDIYFIYDTYFYICYISLSISGFFVSSVSFILYPFLLSSLFLNFNFVLPILISIRSSRFPFLFFIFDPYCVIFILLFSFPIFSFKPEFSLIFNLFALSC